MLTPETFEFVLANELKRAVRSQNFVTLVLILIEPRGESRPEAVHDVAGLIRPELRETDLLATEGGRVSLVLLDADLQNAMRVIDRVMSRLEPYQFTTPLDIQVGAACCPTHGADVDTLRRVAADARTGFAQREPRGISHA